MSSWGTSCVLGIGVRPVGLNGSEELVTVG